MSYINIDLLQSGCPECNFDIFNTPLSYSFEAIDGYKQENGLFEFSFSFDSIINLKLSNKKIVKSFIEIAEEKIYNDIDMCDEWKEVNLLEYKFCCPHCKKNIVAYNFDPKEDFDLGDFDTQVNLSEYKSVCYNSKKHKKNILSLSLNQLIHNTKTNLLGKDFLVKCIHIIHDATFKHRGGSEDMIAEDYDDMLYQAESSENIEHGVQGISTTIVYASINVED